MGQRTGTDTDRQDYDRWCLLRAINLRTTVAVVGAGCTIATGRPTWREFVRAAVEEALRQTGPTSSEPARRLERAWAEYSRPDICATPDVSMYVLGLCDETIRAAASGTLHRWIATHFGASGAGREHSSQPLDGLVSLPIRRFVTTNFDKDVEHALDQRSMRILAGETGYRKQGRFRHGTKAAESIVPRASAREIDLAKMVRFSLAHLSGNDNVVFHCHGSIDYEDSLIATESDYQRLYVSERPEDHGIAAFRNAIDVLLASNPILFVGYGMGDDDLLRPLRILAERRRQSQEATPSAFALMSVEHGSGSEGLIQRFRERYGVAVITFALPVDPSPEDRSDALLRALEDLVEEAVTWKRIWDEKPVIRPSLVPRTDAAPSVYFHRKPAIVASDAVSSRRVSANLDEIERQVGDSGGVVAVVGDGGTGKSWHAMRYVERQPAGRWDGVFFWSSYYSNDMLSGIDRLLGYLRIDQSRADRGRVDRLAEHLAGGKRYLVVIDGFERLLREALTSVHGTLYSAVMRRFIEAFLNPSVRSVLLLTTRLAPNVAQDAGGRTIKIAKLRPPSTEDLKEEGLLPDLSDDHVARLCSLLDGHQYALSLVDALIRRAPPARRNLVADEVERFVLVERPRRRLDFVIDFVLSRLDDESRGFARPLIERVAMFVAPVSEPALDVCWDEVRAIRRELAGRSGLAGDASPSLESLVASLTKAKVLFATSHLSRAGVIQTSYTVHPTVRSYVLGSVFHAGSTTTPISGTRGATSADPTIYPGVGPAVRSFLDLARSLQRAAIDRERSEIARRLLAAALFGLMRSRAEANGAPRWTTFGHHLRLGLTVLDVVRANSTGFWTRAARGDRRRIEAEDGVLHGEELAWLYNDIGLALCNRGSVADAFAVWETGAEINKVLEGEANLRPLSLQSELHFAHLLIDLGRLREADSYLRAAEATNEAVQDEDLGARILGYRALLDHVRGYSDRAKRNYETTLDRLRKCGGNARAEARFGTHLAALLIHMGQYQNAGTEIELAEARATETDHRDLRGAAALARGTLLRRRRRWTDARAQYERAGVDATRSGCRRLEVEVQSELSALAVELGDTHSAVAHAMSALRSANELSMGLRETTCLLHMGRALVAAKRYDEGLSYLRVARELADAQGYGLRLIEIEAELAGLGEAWRGLGGGGDRGVSGSRDDPPAPESLWREI